MYLYPQEKIIDKKTIRNFRKHLRKFERIIEAQNDSYCCCGVTMPQCHILMELSNSDTLSINELAAFGPEYGLPEEIVFQLTTGLACGIAYRGYTCGAVLGSLLVIGLKYGNKIENDEVKKDITY